MLVLLFLKFNQIMAAMSSLMCQYQTCKNHLIYYRPHILQIQTNQYQLKPSYGKILEVEDFPVILQQNSIFQFKYQKRISHSLGVRSSQFPASLRRCKFYGQSQLEREPTQKEGHLLEPELLARLHFFENQMRNSTQSNQLEFLEDFHPQ